MSIALMTVAWKLPDLTMTQKFVLIALCDSANDDGVCYPSVGALMKKCNLSDRGVRKVTSELEQMGFLSKKMRKGHSTVYVVSPELGVVTPAPGAPCTPCTPAPGATTPAPGATTPARGAPITQIETKIETSRNPKNLQKDFAIEEIFEHWREVMDHPKAQLDKKRRAVICNALAWGYSLDVLKQAISGCAKTPHNMGFNDRNQRYDGLELILRSADQIDRFVRNFHHPPALRNKQQQLEAGNTRVLSDWIPPELRHASQ